MYPDSHLNTPPPPSQFRRPWSPDPYDPLPSNTAGNFQRNYDSTYDYPHYSKMGSHHRQQQREGSDVSVEALDLADYSRALRARASGDPFPPFTAPPSLPLRPLTSQGVIQPPRVPTIVSNAPSFPSSARHPSRRPFSLPPSSVHSNSTFARGSHSPQPVQSRARSVESEIDVSRFPVWSRNWYSNPVSGLNSPPDIYPPPPASHLPTNQSPFDPGYKHKEGLADLSSPDEFYSAPPSFDHNSSRDLLPWNNDPLECTPIDPSVKEERMRMLEREFGAQNKPKNFQDGLDEDGNPMIGSVDETGNLVTQGPTKRKALRVLQIILTLTAGVPSIYAALIIKPKAAPPPSGKPPAFILYILSVITLPVLLYLFVFRPCCCQGRRRKGSTNDLLGGGMMVLPVQAMPGGKHVGKKGNKRGRKGAASREHGNVHVNLIVDPHMFRKEEDNEGEDEGWNESLPGTHDGGPGRKRGMAQRRSVFAGLALEEDWKRARSYAKKLSALDAVGLTLWGATFVFILIGQRCPSGSFEGWCNAYNVSSAAACLLSVAFGVSTFFDVKDLHASKGSPRTRM